MAGCSHSCRDEVGMCRECAFLTGIPGEEFQVRTLREQAALQFNLAKWNFRRQHKAARVGSAYSMHNWRQARDWARPHLEAWVALRKLERATAFRTAAE